MTKIAVSEYKAAYMMLDAGLGENAMIEGIKTIKQPTKGYLYASDVCDYIRQMQVS